MTALKKTIPDLASLDCTGISKHLQLIKLYKFTH